MISKKIDEIIATVIEINTNKGLESVLAKIGRDISINKADIDPKDFLEIIDKLAELRQKWAALIEDKNEERKILFAKRFVTFCFMSFKEVLVGKFRDMSPQLFFQILDKLPALSIDISQGRLLGNIANKLRDISGKQDLDAQTTLNLIKYCCDLGIKIPDLQRNRITKLLLNEDITLEDIDARIAQVKAIKKQPDWLKRLLTDLEGEWTSRSSIVAALDASVTPPPIQQNSIDLQDLLKRASESIGQFFDQHSIEPKACTAAFWVSFEMNGLPYVAQFNAGMANGQSVVSQTIYPVSKPEVLYRA